MAHISTTTNGIQMATQWHSCGQGPVVGPYLHIVVVVIIYPLAHR